LSLERRSLAGRDSLPGILPWGSGLYGPLASKPQDSLSPLTLPDPSPHRDRFNATTEDILWYYHELVKALRAMGSTPLVEELERVVSEIERLASQHNRS
jgi:hypothetical protein